MRLDARPFARKGVAPEYLTTDLRRQSSQLIALGWTGRVYRFAPWLLGLLGAGSAFELTPYASDVAWRLPDGSIELTLGERSLVARGIPFRLLLDLSETRVEAATLLGIGCDLRLAPPPGATRINATATAAVAATVNGDRRRVVRTITRTIFKYGAAVAAAAKAGQPLEVVGEPIRYKPTRNDLFAREGSAEKWLDERSGYYFAEALLQDVRFEGDAAAGFRATFYLDETEPLNCDQPGMNINPEVICCYFDCVSPG